MNGCRKEEINTSPLESGQNQEIFDFTHSPFSIKGAGILTEGKMVLWDTSPPSSWSAGFPNEVAIPCPNNRSLNSLVCHAASRKCLDSVARPGVAQGDRAGERYSGLSL